MDAVRWLVACVVAVAPSAALADAAQTNDRLFPLSESSSVNPTTWRSSTFARASAGTNALRVTQAVEMVPVDRLSLRAGIEFNASFTNRSFSPTAQLKYQLLRQDVAVVNLSAAARYKLVGFASAGSEVEALVAVGRSFGPVVVAINFVGGYGLDAGEVDLEGHAGVAYRLGESAMVGLNARANLLVGDAAVDSVLAGGRAFEAIAGLMGAYAFGPAELSLLFGAHAPRSNLGVGVLGLTVLGLNF